MSPDAASPGRLCTAANLPEAMSILLASSILPVVAILSWLYCRDRLREPTRVVAITFGLGALTVVPAIVLELIVSRIGRSFGLAHESGMQNILHAGFTAFAVAALVEELLKFAVLRGYSARHDAFDEPMDGIVYGAAASLGFACAENILYVVLPTALGGQAFGASMGTAVLRALTAVPAHATFGVTMGACIGIARFSPARRGFWTACGISAAIAAHGLYDFGAMSAEVLGGQGDSLGAGGAALGFLVAFAASVMVAVLALARLRRDQEVAMAGGSLPPVHAPRLPMATCILAAATAASAVVAFIAIVVTAAGEEQSPPMSEGTAEGLAALAGIVMLAGLALAAATVVVGIVALVRQPRWRAASIAALVVGAGVGLLFLLLLVLVAAEAVSESAAAYFGNAIHA
jgi:RsiW-degrading membrane proteinase PrsW (M82 family)